MTQPRRTEQQKPVIPDKLYFRIGEVARLLGVETHTLRFWETEFPQIKVAKGGTGQRLYRRRDVEALLEIKQLLYGEGFTIPGARQHLAARARQRPAISEPVEAPDADRTKTREAGLARLRSGLRSLSRQLAEAPGTVAERASGQAEGAHRHRGLHLTGKAHRAKVETATSGKVDAEQSLPQARRLFDGLDEG